ncbi:MAG: HAD family hydrolase [Blastocatellia bacterium]|nr:HAD family hydrolase [Blastocatellia bacterium]
MPYLSPSPSTGNMKKRAIFVDRDGTLNEEVGYITEMSQFRLFDFAAESIKMINDAGWYAVLITNQAGIARGRYSEEFLRRLHAQMELSLSRDGARLDAIYYCPHHPEFGDPPYRQDCNCRKPRPGLIEKAAKEFSLDLNSCYIIGDRISDIETGHTAGTRSVMVMTGYGREEYRDAIRQRPPDHAADNLLAAVRWIFSERKQNGQE